MNGTVGSISVNTGAGLGLCQGLLVVEHSVPQGMVVLESKYCENCGGSFTRPKAQLMAIKVGGGFTKTMGSLAPAVSYKDTGDKFCGPCKARLLLPVDDSAYRQMLPDGKASQHSYHMPHYDDSLGVTPAADRVETSTTGKLVRKRRASQHVQGNILERLHSLFAAHGPLSYTDMATHLGARPENLKQILHNRGIKLVTVALVWPPNPRGGRKTGLYLLPSMVKA